MGQEGRGPPSVRHTHTKPCGHGYTFPSVQWKYLQNKDKPFGCHQNKRHLHTNIQCQRFCRTRWGVELTWILLHDVQSLYGSCSQHGRQRGRETVTLTWQTLQHIRNRSQLLSPRWMFSTDVRRGQHYILVVLWRMEIYCIDMAALEDTTRGHDSKTKLWS